MNQSTFDVVLSGCRTEPLGSYLKALAILRVIGEQEDKRARGYWRGEHFVLRSSLDSDGILKFFTQDWIPTPIVTPWSGGSGFYPNDARQAADDIVNSEDKRFTTYASVIKIVRDFIKDKGWFERPADESKHRCINELRAILPDEAIAWIDASVVVGDTQLFYPPLLGTGGNDGRFDFSNNFQQRVVAVLTRDSSALLCSSIFGEPSSSHLKGTLGQFDPAANEKTNPWDFVLLIEGTLMFAASATRRNESGVATMAFPFHAKAAGGSATVTDSDEKESRNELWLPRWCLPSTYREIRQLFAEGRSKVGAGDGARPASSGLDFARSVSSLGFDRGISSFSRIGFYVRNGQSYYATPLGSYTTGEVGSSRLLDEIDRWYADFSRKVGGKNVPSRVVIAKRRLESAMFEAASNVQGIGAVLLALGAAEQALSRSLSFTKKHFLRPLPSLKMQWADAIGDGSIEQRLGAALAARLGMRKRLLSLDETGLNFGRDTNQGCVFRGGGLVDSLHSLLQREDIEAMQKLRTPPGELIQPLCALSDIAHFINGNVRDARIEEWLRALILIDGGLQAELPSDRILPTAAFAILSLVQNRFIGSEVLPRTPGFLARICGGDSDGATTLAIQRLKSLGKSVPVRNLTEPIHRARRIAAALAFPLSKGQRQQLEKMVLPPPKNN